MAALVADPLLALVLRTALAAVLAGAALHKARDPGAFRAALDAYRLLPAALVAPAAAALVALESGLALALLAPPGRAAGALGTAGLLAVYSGAIAVNLARGRRAIDCGCGGPGARQPLSEWLLARNALLAAAALLTLLPPGARPLVWVDWLALAGALAVLACSWTAAHRLLAASLRVPPLGAAP